MRFAVAALCLTIAQDALAGGVGLLLTGGAHTEKVFFYDSFDNETDKPYPELSDYVQYQSTQTLPNYGGGLEFVIGDKDNKVTGSAKFYLLNDAPQIDPATKTTSVPATEVVANVRETSRPTGMGMIGMNFGIVGSPDKFLVGAVVHVGSGFLTVDHTEFLAIDAGPFASYRVGRRVSLVGDVTYLGRFRKGWSNSANLTLGARYMFD